MNTPVNYPIAKLLKEKGYNEPCALLYDENGKVSGTKMSMAGHPNIYINKYSAPIIAEVVMWFYEKHGVWVKVGVDDGDSIGSKEWSYIIVTVSWGVEKEVHYEATYGRFASPIETYEAAIEYTLNNLI